MEQPIQWNGPHPEKNETNLKKDNDSIDSNNATCYYCKKSVYIWERCKFCPSSYKYTTCLACHFKISNKPPSQCTTCKTIVCGEHMVSCNVPDCRQQGKCHECAVNSSCYICSAAYCVSHAMPENHALQCYPPCLWCGYCIYPVDMSIHKPACKMPCYLCGTMKQIDQESKVVCANPRCKADVCKHCACPCDQCGNRVCDDCLIKGFESRRFTRHCVLCRPVPSYGPMRKWQVDKLIEELNGTSPKTEDKK